MTDRLMAKQKEEKHYFVMPFFLIHFTNGKGNDGGQTLVNNVTFSNNVIAGRNDPRG